MKNKQENILQDRIDFLEKNKSKILQFKEDLKQKWVNNEISLEEYRNTVLKEYKGKTISQWLAYYDSEIIKCVDKIENPDKKDSRKYLKIFLLFVRVQSLL